MIAVRTVVILFIFAAFSYIALSHLIFKVPRSLEKAELCGFISSDFNATGSIAYSPLEAWWVGFTRLEECWTAISIGLAVSFIAFALSAGRRAGGGILAASAWCVSCLAPVLSVVGLGICGALLVGFPKRLIALNTLLRTGRGTLFLSRCLASCAILDCKSAVTAN